jgi:hypothetical protein
VVGRIVSVDDSHDSDLSSILAEETVVEITPSPHLSSHLLYRYSLTNFRLCQLNGPYSEKSEGMEGPLGSESSVAGKLFPSGDQHLESEGPFCFDLQTVTARQVPSSLCFAFVRWRSRP